MSQISASKQADAQPDNSRAAAAPGLQYYYYINGQLQPSQGRPAAPQFITPETFSPANLSWTQTSNPQRFRRLRQAYPEFIYKGFWLTRQPARLQVIYDFSVPGLADFRPELSFPLPEHCGEEPEAVTRRALDPLALRSLFCLGLMESISYWKACCSPLFTVRAAGLDAAERDWWLKLFYQGLGEFLYRNGLDLQSKDLLTIKAAPPAAVLSNPAAAPAAESEPGSSCLIPVGGGKDSVVTLMRTRSLNIRRYAFGVNPGPAALTCMALAGIAAEDQLIVHRKLDQTLLSLNQLGFLNGHTPFSALLAFSSYYTAWVWQIPFVVLSNEASADEPSVAGTDVNHQYSKSYAFEADFRRYTAAYLGDQVYYFSLLRPFAEILIARDFARYPAFYQVFRSCNVGSKQNLWCGHCAKCLFVAIILAPFMSLSALRDIWGKDLFDDPELSSILDELCGLTAAKPFECVGTVGEVRLALTLAIRQAVASGVAEDDLPLLWRHFLDLVAAGRLPGVSLAQPDPLTPASCRQPQADPALLALLSGWQNGQAIPLPFRPCLEGMLAWPADQIRQTGKIQGPLEHLLAYLAHKRILILGMGREGQSSLRFILRHYEALGRPLLGIADARPVTLPDLGPQVRLHVYTGADYLNAMPQYDLVLKSPGISFKDYTETWLAPGILKAFPHTEISGQIDLFLRFPPTARLVGVTGTKGKTTTSTIIADICRGSGWKTWLMGNIGVAVLDAYEQIAAGDIAVLELSCHQLQFVQASPPLALITNLYEEHLDHYRSYDEYCDSKLNIARWQQPSQCFFLNEDDTDLKQRCDGVLRGRVKRIREADGEALRRLNPHLTGRHHAYDLAFAAAVCHELGISTDNILAGIRSFPGIPHRCEYLGDFNGIHFYNDSIATIPRATEYAIETLGNVETLIVGGMDRGLDYQAFIQYLQKSSVSHFICLPDTGRQVLEAMQPAWPERAVAAENMAAAVRLAYLLTPKGSSCLLSPAASSYNCYKNFEARGDDFRRQVLIQASRQTGTTM
ncbi:MAG: UDP-N-acetylmuramoyl-L-alanine--D-glutamate ligase [Oscillospiraceae bacterium]|nr:UDP-N-acetylmuramoyl-L-alanine--D-glutamate ligase [Oscillospiraceae bacterium]